MRRKFLFTFFPIGALLTWPVFLMSLAWAIITNLTDVVNNPEGMYLERVGSVVAAHVVLFTALFVIVRLVRKLSPSAQSVLIIPAIIGLSLFRGLVVWGFLMITGVDSPDMFSYRFFASVATVGLPLTLIGIIVHRIRAYTATRATLLAENERLIALQDTARENIRHVAESKLEEIRSLILGSLATATTNTDEVIDAINHSVDTVLLPQIHELESTYGPRAPEVVEVSQVKIDFGEAFRNAFAAQHLHSVAVGICILVTAAFTIVRNHPTGHALVLLIIAVIGPMVLLSMLKRLLERIPLSTPAPLSGVAFIIGVVGAGFIVGVATLPFTGASPEPLALFFQAPLFITVLTTLFALASSTQIQALAANARLSDTTDRLTWEVARVSAEHRQVKRTLAHALHGPLQAGLLSTVLRLQHTTAQQSESTEAKITVILNELQDLVTSLHLSDPDDAPQLATIVNTVRKTWSGVADVDVQASDSMTSIVESDAQLMRALSELIPELVFNSVKHGNATEVSCNIVRETHNTVILSCVDNGTRPAEKSRVGLGTKLLDEYATRWTRSSDGLHTVTTLVLPFAPVDSLVEPFH